MTKSLVANLYNPHEQSKEQLVERFVVRQKVFRQLYDDIKSSEMAQPGQHYLIEGQRGMGKTTLLLRLSHEIEHTPELQPHLLPIVFKEEAYYGIRRLYNLWETIACELAGKDERFSGLFDQMGTAYDEHAEYERFCFTLLLEALQTHTLTLMLFIDNFGELLRNFDEQEYLRLYDVLKECAHLRIVGASTMALEAFSSRQDGFYELFQTHRLEGLNQQETHELLVELAKNHLK